MDLGLPSVHPARGLILHSLVRQMTKINYRRLDRQPKKRNPIATRLADGEFVPKKIENKKKKEERSKTKLKSIVNTYNNGMDVTDEFE